MSTSIQIQKQNIDKLKQVLNADSVKDQFRNALKDHSDLFVASVIDLYSSDSTLINCDPNAVVKEALKAAVLKLPINKALGFAYVIGYNNSVQLDDGSWVKRLEPSFQMGYKGYIQLAMRTGQYRIINADSVLEGEFVKKNKLTGEFDLTGEATSEKIVGYFAHIEMLNGFSKTLYMNVAKVTNHATKYSKSWNHKNSIWKTNFDEMAIKTVLRNLLSHYGFLSVEMASVMNQDIVSDSKIDYVSELIDQNANREILKFDEAEEVKDTENKNPI